MAELREFVYLDKLSVNSLLASQRVAVPEKVKDASEKINGLDTSYSGEFSLSIPTIGGASIARGADDTEKTRALQETQKKINDQYRFSILYEVLRQSEMLTDLNSSDVKELSFSSGDAVKISGTCDLDPFFQLFNSVSALLRIFQAEQIEHTAEHEFDVNDQKDQLILDNGLSVFDIWKDILHGDHLGMMITNDSFSYPVVMSINRGSLWIDPKRDFYSDKKYTVVGRVNKVVSRDNKWDFIDLLGLMSDIFTDDSVEQFRNILRETADKMKTNNSSNSEQFELDFNIERSDYVVDGPAIVIDPIAIYW